VGCLVGKPEDLPEVQTELTMAVVRLRHGFDGGKVPKIKARAMYRLIIGSNVVTAVCTSFKKPTAVMSLLRPICIIDKKCMIYSADSSNTQLIGFGIMSEEQEEKDHVSIGQSEEEYTTILPQEKKEEQKRTAIPIPVMVRENRNTIWSNLGTFCQVVHRQEIQVVNYIQQELCVTANVCQSGLRIFKVRIQPRKMQKILKKYIVAHVACDQCKGVDTETRKNRRNTEIVCKTCGSSRVL
jgi:translation initiation factor 2 beta subunit (eIF-2beta)/eIF-5